jgi:hypothetical protein
MGDEINDASENGQCSPATEEDTYLRSARTLEGERMLKEAILMG